MEQEEISAFAYKAAKGIEAFINVSNNNLLGEIQLLKAKILEFNSYLQSKDDDYPGVCFDIQNTFKETFNITETREGHM